MSRTKGSKNKKTLGKEGKLDEIESKKLEDKQDKKEQKDLDKSWNEMIKAHKDALIEDDQDFKIELLNPQQGISAQGIIMDYGQ